MTKNCGNHGKKRRRLLKRLFAGLLIFVFLVLLVVLIVWAILRPTKPRFILQDATVYVFNVTAGNFLTSTIQITLQSRNPNDRIGIYYDRLYVYATYRNQQITLRTGIQPTYQGHNEINIWSPFVFGSNVPVAPYNGVALSEDQGEGAVLVMLRVDGRVRWKVGTLITGRYHLYVKCPAYLTFGSKSTGMIVDGAVKYQLVQRCSVSV